MAHASIAAALLDIDGTLVDSNDAHAACWSQVLRDAGLNVPFETVRPLIGMGADQLLPKVAGLDATSPPGKRIAEERSRVFMKDFLSQVRPLPAARELVLGLAKRGLRLVIATSARKKEMRALLQIARIDDLELPATTADDAEESKPEPDIIHAALRRAGCRPSEALLIGDTPFDIEACRKAGVGVVAFRSGGFSEDALAGAIAIYDGPAALLEALDRSPFASQRTESAEA